MNYDALKAQLRIDEGVRYKRYLDTVGVTTIGVGHNVDDDPHYPFSVADEPLSDADVDLLLEEDIAKVVSDLDEHCNWWRAMSEPRQRVLANMCFNMGWGALSQFRNTLDAMHFGHYDIAATNMRISKWYVQVGGLGTKEKPARGERLAQVMENGS